MDQFQNHLNQVVWAEIGKKNWLGQARAKILYFVSGRAWSEKSGPCRPLLPTQRNFWRDFPIFEYDILQNVLLILIISEFLNRLHSPLSQQLGIFFKDSFWNK